MKLKPHLYRGRFYNDANDSTLRHIVGVLKSFVKILWYRSGIKRHADLDEIPHYLEKEWIEQGHAIPERSDDLAITWIGHSGFLIQVDGYNIVTDPVFDEISTLSARVIKPAVTPDKLPPIDIVLISHNHRDHMDAQSLLAIKKWQPRVIVPVGDKKWFTKHGFLHVEEAWWWQDIVVGAESEKPMTISFLPASHWAGRGFFDANKSLWGSWLITGKKSKIYFAGDTAYADHFAVIGKKYPNIDVALMPIGPNEPRYLLTSTHISSEQAVKAFIELGAKHFIPMHWGTFEFGYDSFLLPIQRLACCWAAHVDILKHKMLHVMKFGQSRLFSGEAKNGQK